MKLVFFPTAWDDYRHWQAEDPKLLARVNLVLQECLRHPFKGTGKPELLSGNLTGWSRRIDRREIEAATVRGEALRQTEPRARAVYYDAAADRIVIELTSGAYYSSPPWLAQGLRGASAADLADRHVNLAPLLPKQLAHPRHPGLGLRRHLPRIHLRRIVPHLARDLHRAELRPADAAGLRGPGRVGNSGCRTACPAATLVA